MCFVVAQVLSFDPGIKVRNEGDLVELLSMDTRLSTTVDVYEAYWAKGDK